MSSARRAVTWAPLAVLVLVLTGCGEPEDPPGVPGTYTVDREASQAALLAAAAAMDDAEVTEGMRLPADPLQRGRLLRERQKLWRENAEAVGRGRLDMELTLEADGTWHGRTTREDEVKALKGTWTYWEEELTLRVTVPADETLPSVRYRPGVIELVVDPGLTALVLERR